MTKFEIGSIGDRLKFLRKSKGLTQSEMAEKLDMSFSAYKNYEYGRSTMNIDTLLKVQNATEASLEFIVNGKDMKSKKEEQMLEIRQNTQFETKIEEGCLIITSRIPLFDHIG